MTITQLKYVLAVAEHQNFTKAAEYTFVTQPTLSMQIQKLEEELNITIFDRSKKPIVLTSIGQKIVTQARLIVDEATRMQDVVDQEKGFVGGPFKLGIIPTVMPTLLPMFLKTFTKRFPKVQLSIEELSTQELIGKILEGHLDGAIAATPLGDERLKERVLYYEPFVGYIPEHHRLHKKRTIQTSDLVVEDILLLRDGHCFREGVLNLCQTKNKSKKEGFELTSGSFETLIKLTHEGLGMTLLPYLHSMDLENDKSKNLRHFNPPVPAREIALIYPNSALKMHIIEALHNVISGIIRGAVKFQEVKIISPV